jgi:tRNA-Thr(GGU) m(6)t(6)A37 methyltransferase TsaA
MTRIQYTPIGIIHSPFLQNGNVPVQPIYSKDTEATIEIYDEYVDGIKDLAGFSQIILLFHLDRISGYKLQTVPHFDNKLRGVFATRSPSRPNPIGLSITRLVKIRGNILHIKGIDALDKTPLLDIKPYIQKLDFRENSANGWLDDINL